MHFFLNSRHSILLAILIFYLFPILFVVSYSLNEVSFNVSWKLFAFGLFLSMCGSLIFFLLLFQWRNIIWQQGKTFALEAKPFPEISQVSQASQPHEEFSSESIQTISCALEEEQLKAKSAEIICLNTQHNLAQEALIASQQKQAELTKDLNNCYAELERLDGENKQYSQQLEIMNQEFEHYKKEIEKKLSQEKSQHEDLQQTINEQQVLIEDKMQQIVRLETREKDLIYEIKELLQFADIEKPLNLKR